MKIRLLLCVLVVLTCPSFGCRKGFTEIELASLRLREGNLTVEQKMYFEKYCAIRGLVTTYFRLPEDAKAEEVRPFIAKYLKLSQDSTWGDMLKHPKAKKMFTDERRIKFAGVFCLSTNATWIDLKDTLEGMRFDPKFAMGKK